MAISLISLVLAPDITFLADVEKSKLRGLFLKQGGTGNQCQKPQILYVPYLPNRMSFDTGFLSTRNLLAVRGQLWAEQCMQQHVGTIVYMYDKCARGGLSTISVDVDQHTFGVLSMIYPLRNVREEFFSLLRVSSKLSQESVCALGACQGYESINSHNIELFSNLSHQSCPESDSKSQQIPSSTRNYSGICQSRDCSDQNTISNSVAQYAQFKFAIVFDSSQLQGYFNRRLVEVYLAGAVPIYLGAPDVHEYFNERSMINCNRFSRLIECVERVEQVNSNQTEYLAILAEQPIRSLEAWNVLFSFWEKENK